MPIQATAMPNPAAPGVYMQELASGMRLISGVSTSITAFIGNYPKAAPAPVFIRNWREFNDQFPPTTSGDQSVPASPESSPATQGTEPAAPDTEPEAAPTEATAEPEAAPTEATAEPEAAPTEATAEPEAAPTEATAEPEAAVSYARDAVAGYFQNGGGPCYIVNLAGWKEALEHIPEVKIIVVPDLWNGAAGYDATLADAVVSHCRKMGNRMAILHTELDSPEVGLSTDDGAFAALYYPWVTVKGEDGKGKPVPPSGHIAGMWGRVDANRGVHKAPANEALQGVLSLTRVLTDQEQGELNADGVNCLRVFPGQGIRVWGARTLDTGTDWRYINVRRLFNYLQESIRLGTNWAVFEPNDHRLWSSIHRNVSAFLLDLWRQGALLGRTRDDAFYVICDESNNPPEKLADGQVHCDIGVAAVRPAEFIVFRVTQVIGGPQES